MLDSSYPIYMGGVTHQVPNMSLSYLIFFLFCVKIWHKHIATLDRDVNEMMKYSAFGCGFGTVLDRCEFSLRQLQDTRHSTWDKYIGPNTVVHIIFFSLSHLSYCFKIFCPFPVSMRAEERQGATITRSLRISATYINQVWRWSSCPPNLTF